MSLLFSENPDKPDKQDKQVIPNLKRNSIDNVEGDTCKKFKIDEMKEVHHNNQDKMNDKKEVLQNIQNDGLEMVSENGWSEEESSILNRFVLVDEIGEVNIDDFLDMFGEVDE